jgi:hypothetical protein
MEKEKELTSEESLKLITHMITKAKNDYFDSGLSALLWGSVVTVCSLVTFANYYLQWHVLDYIWFLTVVAIVPQIVIAVREGRERRHKAYEEDLIGGIWISYAIAIFLFSYIASVYHIPQEASVYLILYGIPTFASGYGRRFKPMLIGGIACWVFAILSLFTPFPYLMFWLAAGGQLAWFIPGLILRKRYLKAKRQHV